MKNNVSTARVLAAAKKVQPMEHALVSIRDTRRTMSMPKDEFDSAVMQLSRDGKICLHFHDHPQGVSEQERQDMVANKGEFYVGFSIR